MMKALLYDRFGDAGELYVGQRPTPEPAADEVRVRVTAAAMNPKDVLVRKGKFVRFTGRKFPMCPGYDVCGFVDAVGVNVDGLCEGERVFGMIQSWLAGATAEYVCVPEGQLAPAPDLPCVEAAAIPLAALTALQALRDLMQVSSGMHICLNGASGGVGVYAVQIARILGARVTAVCSARNATMVEELGAHEVLPYDEIDAVSDRRYDGFFDIFGNRPYPTVAPALTPGGSYVTTIPNRENVLRDLRTRWTRKPARLVVVRSNRPDLEQLSSWVKLARLRPVVDRVYAMHEAAEAHRYIETKRARGKVVIRVDDGD